MYIWAGLKNRLTLRWKLSLIYDKINPVIGSDWVLTILVRSKMMCQDNSTIRKKYERITTDIFIQMSIARFGCKFLYDETEYKAAKEKLLITCVKHGVFNILPANHLKGDGGCRKCLHTSKANRDWLADFKSVHGNRYDYSKFVYVKAREKSIIVCSDHGEFLQTYDHHFHRKQGCPKCSKNRSLSKTLVLERFNKAHGDRYDYSMFFKFNSAREKIDIICHKHGVFRQEISSHMNGSKCMACSIEEKISKREEVISSFIKKHGYFYDYSKVDYKKGSEKVEIICPHHGSFMQRPSAHASGRGCGFCNMKNGHDKTSYLKACSRHGGVSKLYIVKMTSLSECFYKIGISYLGVRGRFKRSDRELYNIETVIEVELDASIIWDLETQLHRILHSKKYIPKKKFAGMYECFSDINADVLRMVKVIKCSNQIQLLV